MQVPRSLIWSGGEDCGRIDLGNPHAVAVAYESILDAARDPADLAAYLNPGLLVTAWPYMGMAPATRRAWEEANPELASSRRTRAVPAA
jgi:hypothetical protein